MSGYDRLDEYSKTHRKVAASDVGANAPRSCSDVCFIGFFALVWVGMIIVAIVAVGNGDLARLVSGVDYLGNVCGSGSPKGVNAEVAKTWSSRNALLA